eukprot:6037193-Alexandrium_andersonii.AAC.1
MNATTPTGRPYELVTWGTLPRAFYLCHARHPENANVLASLREGMVDLVVLAARTPKDVYIWLRDKHNGMGNGVAHSILQ